MNTRHKQHEVHPRPSIWHPLHVGSQHRPNHLLNCCIFSPWNASKSTTIIGHNTAVLWEYQVLSTLATSISKHTGMTGTACSKSRLHLNTTTYICTRACLYFIVNPQRTRRSVMATESLKVHNSLCPAGRMSLWHNLPHPRCVFTLFNHKNNHLCTQGLLKAFGL